MTAPRRVAAALAALLLSATLLTPLPAAAQSGPGGPGGTGGAADAGEHFRRGVQLYKEGSFSTALVEFQRAYDVDPKFQVLFNIAESHYQLQDYANALRAFQKYLDEGGRMIPTKRRKDVEAEIVTLSQRVATLTITTSEPGAAVTLDDLPVGKTPLEPIIVSAGRRRVTATLPGRAAATKTIDLAGGDKQAVALEIPAAMAVPEGKEAPPPPPPEDDPSIVPMVVSWSVTGALTVGAVITGVVALGASSDLEDELARFPGDADALSSAKSDAFGFGLATDILIGTAIAGSAVATYFTVDYILASEDVAAEQEEVEETTEEARRTRRSESAAGTARLVVSPVGVTLGGTF